MDKLPLNIKFNIISWIFIPNTVNYLKENGYNFKPELHKYTIRSLVDAKEEIFFDLISNGLYDDNYYWTHNYKYKENKQSNNNYKDLLFVMVEKNIRERKYFTGLIKSNKKNLNLIDKKNNTMALHHYISKLYSEDIICEIISNHELHSIDIVSPTKKGSKCLEMCWNKKYDLLLMKILSTTSTVKINQFIANKINSTDYNYILNNFPKSIPYIYKFASINTQSINLSNANFYLNVTKSHYPKDYEKVLRSSYFYNLNLDKIYIISTYLSSKTNTYISNEIFLKIKNFNVKIIEDFSDDILLANLVKSYEYIIYGTFKDDLLPIVINTIISYYKLEIKFKDIDDFKNKIKTIIPKLKIISNIDIFKEELLLRVIESGNQEYAKLILGNINFDKFYSTDDKEFNNVSTKSKIIYECLNNNLDNLLAYMVIKGKIDLIKSNNWGNYNDYTNTFINLLFKKGKNELFYNIFNNDLIIKKYTKSTLVFTGLCLSIVYNRLEIFIDLLENYKHCIEIKKLFETFKYSIDLDDIIINKIIKNKMNNYLDWVMDKYFFAPSTKIDFKMCDNNGNSVISLLIQYDYIKYIEKIINKLEKDIFKHIPMFTLNNTNLSFSSQLSNGHELYWACKKNLDNIAWFFVSNKLGNINYFDSDGNSSLIFACKNNMNTIAGTLLNSNMVDWRRKNNLGKTALDYAKENKMTQIIEIIEMNKVKNQNVFLKPYNCEINKNNKTNIFDKKEIKIDNLDNLSKLLDKLQNIDK